jgi:2-haloacid dehalogenase
VNHCGKSVTAITSLSGDGHECDAALARRAGPRHDPAPDRQARTGMSAVQAVIFDFGGVLFDWNPDYLYRRLIPDEAERRRFLAEVCNGEWNLAQDAGRPLAAATEIKIAEFPELAHLIDAYYTRWPEMLAGIIPEGVELLEALAAAGVPLFGLTNWSGETFQHVERNYSLLDRFRDILVSGREGVVKPDPEIYLRLLRRNGLDASACVFIDDSRKNADGALAVGMRAIHHLDAARTAAELRSMGLTF